MNLRKELFKIRTREFVDWILLERMFKNVEKVKILGANHYRIYVRRKYICPRKESETKRKIV